MRFTFIALATLASGARVTTSQQPPRRLWHMLAQQDRSRAWKTVFGESGERGEYMDGYSEQAMLDRCEQDYKWAKRFSRESFLSERAKMVSRTCHAADSRA